MKAEGSPWGSFCSGSNIRSIEVPNGYSPVFEFCCSISSLTVILKFVNVVLLKRSKRDGKRTLNTNALAGSMPQLFLLHLLHDFMSADESCKKKGEIMSQMTWNQAYNCGIALAVWLTMFQLISPCLSLPWFLHLWNCYNNNAEKSKLLARIYIDDSLWLHRADTGFARCSKYSAFWEV